MTHDDHGLDLLHRLQCDTDDDEQGRTAEVDTLDMRCRSNHIREDGDKGQEHGARQRDTRQDMIQIICGRLTGADARDEAAVFLQIVRHIRDLYGNSRVEIREEDDQPDVERRLQRLAPLEVAGHRLDPGHIDELGHGHREHQHG